jgi:hypothetical protein
VIGQGDQDESVVDLTGEDEEAVCDRSIGTEMIGQIGESGGLKAWRRGMAIKELVAGLAIYDAHYDRRAFV